jgi:hypothetical protein
MGPRKSSDTSSDGLPKIAELFCFFEITNPDQFRKKLKAFTEKWVTTVSQQQLERTRIRDWKFRQQRSQGQNASTLERDPVMPLSEQSPVMPLSLVNIAFSKSGLSKVWRII